jgi:hypothetical protein
MSIRTYRRGDELAQVRVYNAAAGSLPKFKPATIEEARRRCLARDFDATSRFYAEADGRIVGYATFQANGRVSFPWTEIGYERFAEPLLDAVLKALRERGMTRVFAAYRGDWPTVEQFFLGHEFNKARDIVNYITDMTEMPTPAARPAAPFSSLRREDLPGILALAPEVLRVATVAALEKHFFQNPCFGPESVFVSRVKEDRPPIAVGILILDNTYADPQQLDAAMPCFRLGAFGAEGMTTKRVNGLFSFLTPAHGDVMGLGLDLLGQAAMRLGDFDSSVFAAQVASDVPHLYKFYERIFRRQGSFPLFERTL